jgi:hypothetical protein
MVALSAVGCNSRVPTYRIHGKVIYKGGQPFTDAMIVFETAKPPYTRAMMPLDNKGEFVVDTGALGSGVEAGESRVYIARTPGSGSGPAAEAAFKKKIDEKYTNPDTSGLTITVVANQDNDFTIEVTKPGQK